MENSFKNIVAFGYIKAELLSMLFCRNKKKFKVYSVSAVLNL